MRFTIKHAIANSADRIPHLLHLLRSFDMTHGIPEGIVEGRSTPDYPSASRVL